MNVLTIFEQRIGAIFEEGAPGTQPPIAFRRLAKRLVREMEDETFVIDGVDTAPALYTILVSAVDDAVMRPLYVNITDEISQLIEAQAKKRGYTFVGRPLVRFMVDPALRHARFSAFAENIDPRTLARLRDEENAYLGVTPPQDDFAADDFVPEPIPVLDEEPAFVAGTAPEASEDFDLIEDLVDEPFAEDFDEPFEDDLDEPFEDDVENEPENMDEAAGDFDEPDEPFGGTPLSYRDLPDPLEPDGLEVTPVEEVPACTLTDLESGQIYHVEGEVVTIGRERMRGSVILRDPNASRRHAELTWEAGRWHMRDLGSTNGTLVNDTEVEEATLADGDVLTIGITNLEFRAG